MESSTRELDIVPDGAASAPAAPDVVLDARYSLANVLTLKGYKSCNMACYNIVVL